MLKLNIVYMDIHKYDKDYIYNICINIIQDLLRIQIQEVATNWLLFQPGRCGRICHTTYKLKLNYIN